MKKRLEIGTGVIEIETQEHNDEIKFDLSAYDMYEGAFDQVLINKDDVKKIIKMLSEVIGI